ncbi:hypothetical protein MHI48_20295 [Paenibacillus sp. FSL H7-0942]|uniref:hypothetical protein n=1 Tax=Paenibacillus TaxID=44249 RepID=UPI00096F3BDD|nr:hypothetical protein [Paenibacillus amylolyticus]OMF06288.1 hypothetical protein BK129_11435 [Paenibacillus amylolyticus]
MNKKSIILIATGIIIIWAGFGWGINTWINPSYRGTFGDMFGAVNSLFSGLAFAGLIYTIAVQRQELQAQSKSIDMQTDEMKIQVSAIKMQTEELSLQRAAVQMQTEEIRMQREEAARSANQLEGQKNLLNLQMAMSVVNELIKTKNIRKRDISYDSQKGADAIHYMTKVNLHFWKDRRAVKLYLELFYFILKFIEDYDLEDKQKKILRDLLIVETTDDEVEIFYIEAASDEDKLKLLKVSGFDRDKLNRE